jgi:hypothetical protein
MLITMVNLVASKMNKTPEEVQALVSAEISATKSAQDEAEASEASQVEGG